MPTDAPQFKTLPRVAAPDRSALAPGRRLVSPLLPVLLPLIVAAILVGVLFAWLLPPVVPVGTAPLARFTDVTVQSGVNFRRVAGATSASLPPTTLGGAVVVFDYNGDGYPDLFFVNGAPWPGETAPDGAAGGGRCALFRNDGHGHFTDVSHEAGLDVALQGMGAAAGDYDNDGHIDLFVACVGRNHLFHNRGDGTFEDVTLAAGVGGDDHTWSTGAAWVDVDGSGKLGLVVTHYARWPAAMDLGLALRVAELGPSYGTPTGFVGAFPSVYRNLGDGRFALVPGSAGLRNLDPETRMPVARTLAVVPVDTNGDGKLDLLFTYQAAESALFINQGDGSFRQWSPALDNRNEGAAAGLATPSLLPLAPAAGSDERLAALLSAVVPDAGHSDETALNLRSRLGFALLNYDHGGHLDLFSGDGRAEADVCRFEQGRDFRSVPQLLWNRNWVWTPAPVPGAEGGAWAVPLVARGVAEADLDGDGSGDVIIAQNSGPALVLHNDQRSGRPWLRIALVATRTQWEAGGARVEVHTPRRVQIRTMAPAMGFMAQSESVLDFGLEEDARVRKIVIRWPSGQRQELRPDAINRTLVIREP
jgi:hypothetical protein